MTATTLDWDRVASATREEPLRVLTSACLVGRNTGWEGTAYTHALAVLLTRVPNVRVVSFCPEDFVLTTPRALTFLHGGDGRDVLAGRAKILDTDQRDHTQALTRGAHAMLAVAKRERIELAVLTDISDSCGTSVTYRGDPTQDKQFQAGPGVAAALLLANGFAVISERDARTLHQLLHALDDQHVVDPSALDATEQAWYREYFRVLP
ncbi:MAG: 2-thiouracil desulfurase family protein [Deltaproteobacteria bacterium]|nr:2-thiouracil desulfurase family protein [Deltaproteobacteria bacterium]